MKKLSLLGIAIALVLSAVGVLVVPARAAASGFCVEVNTPGGGNVTVCTP